MNPNPVVSRALESSLATNKVIRNTYTLLAMTLLFSAAMAGLGVLFPMGAGMHLITSVAAIGLLWFVLPRTANSAAGIGVVFAITGLLGFGLGPTLSYYLSVPNGAQIVGTAFAGTGVIFLGLSGYALASRKDFSFMGGFLFVGLLVALLAMVANIFLAIPALSLTISAVVIMIMSGFILYDTSRMVHGGETNYLFMTVSLYLSILNIFVHLLHLLGALSNDD